MFIMISIVQMYDILGLYIACYVSKKCKMYMLYLHIVVNLNLKNNAHEKKKRKNFCVCWYKSLNHIKSRNKVKETKFRNRIRSRYKSWKEDIHITLYIHHKFIIMIIENVSFKHSLHPQFRCTMYIVISTESLPTQNKLHICKNIEHI